ncbi:MAG: RHS repeat protein [Zoogloea sp.]|nr:RHS repeat protein [Zoogloea sp.]
MANRKIGSQWRHSYDRQIKPLITNTISFATVTRASGRAFSYVTVNGLFISEADIPDVLQRLYDANGSPSGWIYFKPDNVTEIYDVSGRLLSIRSPSGRTETLAYDSVTGNLSSVTDNFGRSLAFHYDASGRINRVVDPAGAQVTYTYTASNNLSTITYPDGTYKTYSYNESQNTIGANLPSALTGIVDESGVRYATYQYDNVGRAVGEFLADNIASYRLSFGSGNTTVTDPLGTARVYSFQSILGVTKSLGQSKPGGSGCMAAASSIVYDAKGNVTRRTDFSGNTTEYTYDTSRNLETKRLEAWGREYQRTISTRWHGYWRYPMTIAEPRKITTYVYNGDGGVLCAPSSATIPIGHTGTLPIAVLCKRIEQPTTDTTGAAGFNPTNDGPARTWTYTYNQYGQVLTADGPRTDVADITTYTYYPDSTANWTLGDLKSVTNALGHVWNYTRYDKAGRLLAASDPNGTAYTFTYTPRGWLKTRSVAGQTTTFDYTPWGGVARVTLPDGTFTAYTWDAAHRLTDISDNLGNATHLTLDNAGNITESSTTDPQGRVARRTRTDFDALGRPWKHYDAAGNVTETRHDAEDRLNALVDAKNRTTTYSRDTLGRVQSITNPLPSPGYSGFNYDALDQLTRFVAPNGATTTFTVDGLGNLKQELSADRGTVTATFDAAGNLLTRTDARGASAAHTYDALDRRTRTQLKNSAGTVKQTLTYTWDSAAGCANGKGRLCKLVDGAGTTTFNYDSRGNRISETRLDGGTSYTTQYTFNAADRLIAVIAPTGTLLDQALDGAGRVQSQTTTQGGSTTVVASAITYDGAGTPTQLMHAGGLLPQILQRNTDGKLEASSLGNNSVLMGILFGQRFIPSGGSTNFLVTMTPPQAGGTIRLCRLDCLGPNLLAEGSPVDGVRITGSIQGLPVGVHHLYAVFTPNPPFVAITSQTRRLFVGIPPNRFFEDLLP